MISGPKNKTEKSRLLLYNDEFFTVGYELQDLKRDYLRICDTKFFFKRGAIKKLRNKETSQLIKALGEINPEVNSVMDSNGIFYDWLKDAIDKSYPD